MPFSGGDYNKCLLKLLEKRGRSGGWTPTHTKASEKITALTRMFTWMKYHWDGYGVPPCWCLHKELPQKILGKWDGRTWYLFWDRTAICISLGVIHSRAMFWMDGGGQTLTLLSLKGRRKMYNDYNATEAKKRLYPTPSARQRLSRIASEKLVSGKRVSLKETFRWGPLWQCSSGSRHDPHGHIVQATGCTLSFAF